MISSIVAKDIRLLRREYLLLIVSFVCMLLLVLSALAGMQRESVFAKEKAAAEHTDSQVWMNQGDRNPHSAAHFSRYAFRPSPPLALIDPGISDFAGLAVWMEAHYQDPAQFRRAEDSGALSRYLQLTPANLFLITIPLLVFLALYGGIAGEREDGTLKQYMATGGKAHLFFAGKLFVGLSVAMSLFTVLFLLTAIFSLVTTPSLAGPDALFRAVAMYGIYAVYLTCCVALALAISALFSSRQNAFLVLICAWAFMTIILPRFAADVGTRIHPQPDALELSAQLGAASSMYYNDEALQQEVELAALQAYDVSSVEDLPIEYGAYTLQASEELAAPEFDRIYASLDRQYQAQNSVMLMFSLLSPAIATASLSQGIAGTDSLHQSDFTAAAESHRRDMIKLLNDNYMLNAGDKGYAYTADEKLWAQFSDFSYEPPRLNTTVSAYITEFLILLAWAIAALGIAYILVLRSIRRDLSS